MKHIIKHMAGEHNEFKGGAEFDPMTGNFRKKDVNEGSSDGTEMGKINGKPSGQEKVGMTPAQQELYKVITRSREEDRRKHGQTRMGGEALDPNVVSEYTKDYRSLNYDGLRAALQQEMLQRSTEGKARAAAVVKVIAEKGYLDQLTKELLDSKEEETH